LAEIFIPANGAAPAAVAVVLAVAAMSSLLQLSSTAVQWFAWRA